jgi:hypothetical protein
LQRVLKTGKAVYLVDLKIYPGRVEFDYLPPNTQGVICQPMGQEGVLILAANAPRSYTSKTKPGSKDWLTSWGIAWTNDLWPRWSKSGTG